jgi:magnesium transporter
MFYRNGKELTPLSQEGPVHWKNVIAVLTWEELEKKREILPPELVPLALPPAKSIRFCKVEPEGEHLWGTFFVPAKGERRRMGFVFSIWQDNILFVDDSGFVAAAMEKLRESLNRDPPGAGHVFCDFVDLLIQKDLEDLMEMEEKVSTLENAALEGKLKDLDHRMMTFRKGVSVLSHYYMQLADMAIAMQENSPGFFTAAEQQKLKLLSERASRLREETHILREYLMQIREVYQAQIGIRQNEIMKFLTAVTTVFLPLSLIAGWYGMNFSNMPELEWQFGYPLVAAVSAGVAVLCIWYFKKKDFW